MSGDGEAAEEFRYVSSQDLGVSDSYGPRQRVVPTEKESLELVKTWDDTWKNIWADVDSGKSRRVLDEEFRTMDSAILAGAKIVVDGIKPPR